MRVCLGCKLMSGFGLPLFFDFSNKVLRATLFLRKECYVVTLQEARYNAMRKNVENLN